MVEAPITILEKVVLLVDVYEAQPIILSGRLQNRRLMICSTRCCRGFETPTTLNIHKPCPSFSTGTKYFSTSIHIFNHNSFGEKSSQQLLLFKLSLNSVGFSSAHQITFLKYHKYEPSLQNHNIIYTLLNVNQEELPLLS